MTDSERIGAFIARIYDEGSVTGADGSTFDIRPLSVTPERGRFITDLCRSEGVCAALEIGMAWGLSTLCILAALTANDASRAAHVVTESFSNGELSPGGFAVDPGTRPRADGRIP